MSSDILRFSLEDIRNKYSEKNLSEFTKQEIIRIFRMDAITTKTINFEDKLKIQIKNARNTIDINKYSQYLVSEQDYVKNFNKNKKLTKQFKKKCHINKDGMITIFVAITKNKNDDFEFMYWYMPLAIPKVITKKTTLCMKGKIEYEDDILDFFNQYTDSIIENEDDDSDVVDSDDNTNVISHKKPIYMGKKSNQKSSSSSSSDNEFDEVADSASEVDNEVHVNEEPQSDTESVKSNKLITGGGSKEDVSDESSEEEEDVEEVEQSDFKNKFPTNKGFSEYLKKNGVRSKNLFKSEAFFENTIKILSKEIQNEFQKLKIKTKPTTKTDEYVTFLWENEIVPKKE